MATTEHGRRTFRVSRVRSVSITRDPVTRPEGFDLETAWQGILSASEERRRPLAVTIRADPAAVPILRFVLGTRLTERDGATAGRVELIVRGSSPRVVAGELAGFGDLLEVVDPLEVRRHLAQVADQLRRVYGPSGSIAGPARAPRPPAEVGWDGDEA